MSQHRLVGYVAADPFMFQWWELICQPERNLSTNMKSIPATKSTAHACKKIEWCKTINCIKLNRGNKKIKSLCKRKRQTFV